MADKPNTNAVMHQQLHAVGPAVGKDVGAVRLSRIERGDPPD